MAQKKEVEQRIEGLLLFLVDLQKELKKVLLFLADLNGSDWIKDDGPGGIDMRQRSKAIQKTIYELIGDSDGKYKK